MDEYAALFEGQTGKHSANGLTDEGRRGVAESIKKRQEGYRTMVNNFYDLVTDFYEYGCRLGMKPGVKALDVGCGVGGPMRNMAIFSGASIEGITINEYQVKNLPGFTNGELWEGIDYGDMDWTGKFGVALEIEDVPLAGQGGASPRSRAASSPAASSRATSGSCSRTAATTARTRAVAIKEGIEIDAASAAAPEKVVAALEAAGFEVLEHYDANRNVHSPVEIPWYDTLNGKFTLSGFRMTNLGATARAMVTALETLRIAPKGTTHVSAMLNATALDLVEGGKQDSSRPLLASPAE
ncbi:sterol 24-C-methyltransferase [Aureococcus anophagefferens]|nr:sterol 24-C-methyltransferase [Aureococcus anophagefferens]